MGFKNLALLAISTLAIDCFDYLIEKEIFVPDLGELLFRSK